MAGGAVLTLDLPDLQAPPALSAAYRRPFVASLALGEPGAPSSLAPVASPGPSADVDLFLRHHAVGKVGLYVGLAGDVVAVVGVTWLLVDALGCALGGSTCDQILQPLVVTAVGGAMAVGGTVAMFYGTIAAGQDAMWLGWDGPPQLAWVGLGLFVGGEVVSIGLATAGATSERPSPLLAVNELAGLAGTVGWLCCAWQLGHEGRLARDRGLVVTLVPEPNGLALAGRF